MPSPRGNLLLAAAALVVGCMPFYATPYHMQLASTAMIAAMFALSLQLLVGGAGMVSLAQAAFFGLGAYAVHLLGRALGAATVDPAQPAGLGRGRGHRRAARSGRSPCARAGSSS